MRVFRLLLAVSLGLSAAGALSCSPKHNRSDALSYSDNAKRAYDKALQAYFDGNWEIATQLMEGVRAEYGYSRYSRLAELRLADIAYRQGRFPEAVATYKSFVAEYPSDPEVPYARYRAAEALYKQLSPSLLLPPLYERDLGVVHDTRATLVKFLRDYPHYKLSPDLRLMLRIVNDILVRHELYVARFYRARDQFPGTIARIEFALEKYPESGLEPEALVLLGETYLMMKRPDDAQLAFAKVLEAYPDSAFIIPAKNFLQFIYETSPKAVGQ
jgi:outer membrane protein assembly factor BamD